MIVFLFVPLVLCALLFWLIGYRRGVEPLTKLKPGRYSVDAVIYDNDKEVMLAISWHADYGHYERRLARIPRTLFGMTPETGGQIIVHEWPGPMSIYGRSGGFLSSL